MAVTSKLDVIALVEVARKLAKGAGYSPSHCPSCDAATGLDEPHRDDCELAMVLLPFPVVDGPRCAFVSKFGWQCAKENGHGFSHARSWS